jgi:transcriptional regulator with XRE-family HTH domain
LKDQTPLRILGDRIRAARKERGWSQEELAFECEIDRSYVGGVERGERNLSFLTLCQIARTLGSDVGTLTQGLPRPSRSRKA